MSAFVCMPEHFRELALYAAQPVGSTGPRVSHVWLRSIAGPDVAELMTGNDPSRYPELLANILFLENVRSVRYRYPDGDLPGPVDMPECITIESFRRKVKKPVHILKMCHCLAYQCCETPDWQESTAYKLLQAIQECAICELPGYDAAPWEYIEDCATEGTP